jgi:ribonuclease HII
MPDLALERRRGVRVAGIDEAGRGPLAGPVVAAAVIIDSTRLNDGLMETLDDSKKLERPVRERLFAELAGCAWIGVGAASGAEIDRLNILNATLLAMARAAARLPMRPDFALVDGNRLPRLPCPAEAVIGGDGVSLSIAAASIIAKVTRDRLMARLARRYPAYGWDTNAGYPTKSHRAALLAFGASPHHRRSFGPVRDVLIPTSCG